MKNPCPRCSLAGDHRESSRLVIAIRDGHDHQGQRVFCRSVRPRVDNFDHRGLRVYECSTLAVLYLIINLTQMTENLEWLLSRISGQLFWPTLLESKWCLQILLRIFITCVMTDRGRKNLQVLSCTQSTCSSQLHKMTFSTQKLLR